MPALAAASPGKCAAGTTTASSCQFEVQSYTQAPILNQSQGVRLDNGAVDVLFNNYSGIGPDSSATIPAKIFLSLKPRNRNSRRSQVRTCRA
jgi:hypothetical protein